MSESDVCRRQILTSKDGPQTERVDMMDMNQDNTTIIQCCVHCVHMVSPIKKEDV